LNDQNLLTVTLTDYVLRGATYFFRLRAKNEWGWGVYSEYVAIIAARRPLPITDIRSSIKSNGDFFA
jgi:hypothetical protein